MYFFFFFKRQTDKSLFVYERFDDRQQTRLPFDVIAAGTRSQTIYVLCSQRRWARGGEELRFCATDDAEIIRIARTDSRASRDCLRAVCQTSARELWNLAVTSSN